MVTLIERPSFFLQLDRMYLESQTVNFLRFLFCVFFFIFAYRFVFDKIIWLSSESYPPGFYKPNFSYIGVNVWVVLTQLNH